MLASTLPSSPNRSPVLRLSLVSYAFLFSVAPLVLPSPLLLQQRTEHSVPRPNAGAQRWRVSQEQLLAAHRARAIRVMRHLRACHRF